MSPHYFQTMGIPLLQGRGFAPTDDSRAEQITLINQAQRAMRTDPMIALRSG